MEARRSDPSGTIKIVCPLTMAREILAPLLKDFIARFPSLRMEIEPYSFGWDQEPREDVDVFFKLKAPKDSVRRVRSYPGTCTRTVCEPGIRERGPAVPANPRRTSPLIAVRAPESGNCLADVKRSVRTLHFTL